MDSRGDKCRQRRRDPVVCGVVLRCRREKKMRLIGQIGPDNSKEMVDPRGLTADPILALYVHVSHTFPRTQDAPSHRGMEGGRIYNIIGQVDEQL